MRSQAMPMCLWNPLVDQLVTRWYLGEGEDGWYTALA